MRMAVLHLLLFVLLYCNILFTSYLELNGVNRQHLRVYIYLEIKRIYYRKESDTIFSLLIYIHEIATSLL